MTTALSTIIVSRLARRRPRAFITSANLSDHALETNIETGVLINGPVPTTLNDHLQASSDTKFIGHHA